MTLRSDYLTDVRIVIIGAGVVGAAIAYRLAQAGAHVTTVERDYPGAGASGNTFAWLNGFEKPPKHYHRLNVMSIRDHQDLADELDGDWVRVNGGIHWENELETDRVKTLRASVRQLREWGQRVDTTTPDVVMRELEPDLWIDPEKVDQVYVMPREGTLDSVAMAHGALHAAILRYGAKLVRGTVVALKGPHSAIDTVVLDNGSEFSADIVINAAGADAGRVAALAGVKIPLTPTRGLTVGIPPAPVCLKHIIHAPEAMFRPTGGGRLTIRNREVDVFLMDGQSVSLDSPLVTDVMNRFWKLVPDLAKIQAEWVRMGTRPMPSDGFPIVGFDPAVAGFYTVVTHSGITLSARLALLVTEELMTGECRELEPYRPSRFGNS